MDGRTHTGRLFGIFNKRFLVDLTQVEAIWRVLLFRGFGCLFLALSYYLRSLWRPGATERGGTHRSGYDVRASVRGSKAALLATTRRSAQNCRPR